MRLLVIEDDNTISKPLVSALEKSSYAVDLAVDGQQGLRLAKVNEYDCILLDLNLPKLDGIELATKLRQAENTTPIIMLTARTRLPHKLEGFNVGADDYITKPFNLQELLARISAVIKRNSVNKIEQLTFGPFELFPKKNSLSNQETDEHIQLSTKEASLLEYLLRQKGNYVSSEELLEHVWDEEVDMFSDTVRTHIKTLRQKFDPQKKYLQTTRGKGYAIIDK